MNENDIMLFLADAIEDLRKKKSLDDIRDYLQDLVECAISEAEDEEDGV